MSASLLDTLRQWAAAERDNDAAELANARALRDEILSAWQQPRQDVPGEIYVVVCANDKPHPTLGMDAGGAIVHETYVKHATLNKAAERAANMERWGACRVGRVVFEDVDGRPL